MEQKVPPRPWRLNALDQIMPPAYIRISLIFPVQNVTAAIDQLKAGAELLGSTVPFLLGHVGFGERPEEAKACLEILPHVEGDNSSLISRIQYLTTSYSDVILTSHAHVEAVADPSHLPLSFLADLTTPAPILRLQINALKDGIILGLAAHHGVVDGTGLGILVRELGACCRAAKAENPTRLSVGITTEVQLAARALLGNCTAPSREAGAEEDKIDEFICRPASSQPADGLGSVMLGSKASLSTRTFPLQGRKVQALKSKVNKIIGALSDLQSLYSDISWVSSNDIVMALAWMSFNRARLLANGQSPRDCNKPDNDGQQSSGGIGFSVNIRKRIEPELPASFLGNASIPVRQPLPITLSLLSDSGDHSESTDDLCLNSVLSTDNRHGEWYIKLCRIALSLREKLNTVDNTRVKRVLSYISEPTAPKTVAHYPLDIMVTSWRDTGIYDVDFGDQLGYPVDMRVDEAGVGGLFLVLPKRRAPNETWELKATADPDTMKHLKEDTFGGVI